MAYGFILFLKSVFIQLHPELNLVLDLTLYLGSFPHDRTVNLQSHSLALVGTHMARGQLKSGLL